MDETKRVTDQAKLRNDYVEKMNKFQDESYIGFDRVMKVY